MTPKFFPYEFTPLYVGMPSLAPYSKPIALGGGYVEPLGFNAQPPRKHVVSRTGSEVSESGDTHSGVVHAATWGGASGQW